MRCPRRILASLATGLCLAVLAPAPAADSTRTVKVTATEFDFQPSTIEAQAGETLRIKLVNDGALSHNLHIKGAGAKTTTIQGGNTDTMEFTVPEDGTIEFFCKVPGHEQAGMTGEIVTR